MENLFNILWVLLGVAGIVVALVFRARVGLGGKREFRRDLLLFAAIVFLLLPVVSMSDDIGYFNYFFSRGQAPDCVFWVSGSRREKQMALLLVLQVFAVLLATMVTAFRRRTVLGMVPSLKMAPVVERDAATAYLRAPPSSLL